MTTPVGVVVIRFYRIVDNQQRLFAIARLSELLGKEAD